jgi:2,3-bisphosphoglycerate-dependent phosphoglycerate mutase
VLFSPNKNPKLNYNRKFPKTESLKDCMQRTIPYFVDKIMPDSIDKGKIVLIASSENAIRLGLLGLRLSQR